MLNSVNVTLPINEVPQETEVKQGKQIGFRAHTTNSLEREPNEDTYEKKHTGRNIAIVTALALVVAAIAEFAVRKGRDIDKLKDYLKKEGKKSVEDVAEKSKSESKPEVKPETKPEVKPETKPEVKPESAGTKTNKGEEKGRRSMWPFIGLPAVSEAAAAEVKGGLEKLGTEASAAVKEGAPAKAEKAASELEGLLPERTLLPEATPEPVEDFISTQGKLGQDSERIYADLESQAEKMRKRAEETQRQNEEDAINAAILSDMYVKEHENALKNAEEDLYHGVEDSWSKAEEGLFHDAEYDLFHSEENNFLHSAEDYTSSFGEDFSSGFGEDFSSGFDSFGDF